MQLSTQTWQATIKTLLVTALPADADLVAFHQSRGSESLYASVLIADRLYDFRFAYHPVRQPAPRLHVINLRQFASPRPLTQTLQTILQTRQAGWPLAYGDFVLLSLVEKVSQTAGLIRHHDHLQATEIAISPALVAALADAQSRGWLLTRFKTGQIVLTTTGRAVLDTYWQVAEARIDEPVWDRNPRIATPLELAAYFQRRA